MSVPTRESERRRRLMTRAAPVVGAMAAAALAAGLIVGASTDSGAEGVARDFAKAWARGDYRAMHDLLSPAAKERYPLRSFEAAYANALATATGEAPRVREPSERGGLYPIPVRVRTRVFGDVAGEVPLAASDEAIDWAPHMVFPGLRDGERLTRRTRAPRRATIKSIDGKVLAQGPAEARTSPLGEIAASVAGTMDTTDDPAERRRLFARGFPGDTPVGSSGLERALQRRLEGDAGGELVASGRVLARRDPRRAPTVRSTIDSRLQEAAVTALAGRFGGVVALEARTAQVRALAGVAFSAPQPPGSTFKIVTTTAALEARLVKPTDKFPVETKAVIDGVELENANGESCGGSFADSFAHSCNSVFGPLGVKVGAKRLSDAAERYGWNAKPTIPGARSSTISDIGDSPLEIGSSAIGQYKVLATPLQMASVAQTVGNRGVRVDPTLVVGERPVRTRVTSARVARTLRNLMVGAVDYGTGTAAAIPEVKVAGKTGTAELEDTRGPEAEETTFSDPMNTDAWFTAFAPAARPRIVVATLFVRNGAGGATAAPAARIVLGRALGK